MGNGGYNGGSTIIRAGVGFVSTPRGKRSWASGKKKAKTPKAKRTCPGFSGHMTPEEARQAGLSVTQWQKQAARHVSRLEREITEVRARFAKLAAELKLAERARQAAFRQSSDAAPESEG